MVVKKWRGCMMAVMNKKYNITGACNPEKHYMVDLSSRLKQIKELVDSEEYFVINRARQYGKTTTLKALAQYLQQDYCVFSISFESIGNQSFEEEGLFCNQFFRLISEKISNQSSEELSEDIKDIIKKASEDKEMAFEKLSRTVTELCRKIEKPIVLIIDEVDQAGNYQTFVKFLGILRAKFLDRDEIPTFHSVILAGLYDIKNLKLKLRPEEGHQYNGPWNIAANFDVDMSFSASDIEGMLSDYRRENKIDFDAKAMADLIYDYTSGYPFMVSRLCKILDEELVDRKGFKDLAEAWTEAGLLEAVKTLLLENNTLFDSMNHKLEEYSELNDMLYSLLFTGKTILYNPDNRVLNLGMMFGFIKQQNNEVVIANRIFETRLYNRYLSSGAMQKEEIYDASVTDKNQFIENGYLNMDLVLTRFVQHFSDIYGESDDKFIEENGRKLFLLYLRPIINGTGNYYIEAETRDKKRTDVIVDYLGKQYVIEMKIWHGAEYNQCGEKQLAEYLEYYHLDKGYMLSFNFNKNKQVGIQEVLLDNKLIIEAVV